MDKKLGVLLPIASLNSQYGIGDFGKSAREFIDFLSENDYKLWEILPLNNLDHANCPYSSNAALSIEELYMDLEPFYKSRLVRKAELQPLTEFANTRDIEYEKVIPLKKEIISIIFDRLSLKKKDEIKKFMESNTYFKDYALYMALTQFFGTQDWHTWPEDIKRRYPNAIEYYTKLLYDRMLRFAFTQKVLEEQFTSLREYAHSKGIKFVGDIGIYLDKNSFDVWKNPELFKLNEELVPYVFGGVPGQFWGTCIYNWQFKYDEVVNWWINRIKNSLEKYDYLRLDHLTGFGTHYEIPNGWGEPYWYPGGGGTFFERLFEQVSHHKILVENIGFVCDDVAEVMQKYKLKGMYVMDDAFDGNPNNCCLPQNGDANSVFFIGTHDCPTLIGLIEEGEDWKKQNIYKHYNVSPNIDSKELAKMMIIDAVNSNSEIVFLNMHDLLFQDASYRINLPGIPSGQWRYKLPNDYAKNAFPAPKHLKIKE